MAPGRGWHEEAAANVCAFALGQIDLDVRLRDVPSIRRDRGTGVSQVVHGKGRALNAGLRSYKQASCRIGIPDADLLAQLDEDLRPYLREMLDVQSSDQGHGHASALLHQVTTEADFNSIVLLITVAPFAAGLHADKLERFYTKHGFSVVGQAPLLMARQPVRPRLVTQ